MEVRTYRVPKIGSGTRNDPWRPKYLDEATACGNKSGTPCGVPHTATCECIGYENDGKGGTRPIMKDLPESAWVVTFRCHDDLWALLDADPECVLLLKHECASDTEACIAAQDEHVAEARALVGVK